MSPTKFDTEKALTAAAPYRQQLREMYAYEQALGSPGTYYHYPLTASDAAELERSWLITRDNGHVQLTWQGRKLVRDHL